MRLSSVEKLLRSLASKGTHLPISLTSESGLGKSAIVKQVAKDLDIGCMDLRLATQEAGDLIGIPRGVDNKTVWLKPHWFPEPGTRGILFLDELNRAPGEVRQCVFGLLTEWKLHEHVLPEGWIIVVAMNPDSGKNGYQVETLDPAMLNRMLLLNVDLSVDEWLAWAHKAKLDARVIQFIASQKTLLHKVKPDGGAFPSPRTWEYVSRLLQSADIEESCLTEVISGLVGAEAAASFCQWVKKNFERPVGAQEIMEDYSAVISQKIKDQSRSQNHVTASDLAGALVAYHKEGKKLSKNQRSAVRKFVFDLGGDTKGKDGKHDDVVVAFLRKLPPSLLSMEIVGESSEEANKLAQLYNEISRAAEVPVVKKK